MPIAWVTTSLATVHHIGFQSFAAVAFDFRLRYDCLNLQTAAFPIDIRYLENRRYVVVQTRDRWSVIHTLPVTWKIPECAGKRLGVSDD